MPVAGEVAIVHTLRHLIAFGVRHVVINLHHYGNHIVQLLGDGRQFGLSIRYSWEASLLDSGGGVRRACSLLPEGGCFFVCNADVVADVGLRRLWQRMPTDNAGAVLALVANPVHHPEGDFTLEHAHVGLPSGGLPTWTYSGVSLWSQAVTEDDGWGDCFSLLEPMRALIATGQLYGIIHRGQWCDIGRPKDLLTLRWA